MKNLLYVYVLIMLFPLGAFACYGELCSTSYGAVYDYPIKVINKLTVPELIDPKLILNDPKDYIQRQSANNGNPGLNYVNATICNGKKCIIVPKISP